METVENNIDHSVDGAAAAIEALLSGSGTGEAATTETPAAQADEIQSQPAAVSAPADEANASEEVQAPASEVPATSAIEQPKAQPVSSPELDVRLGEASKATQEATAARDQLLNALNVYVPQLEAAVKGQFADIKTQDDLLALGDPSSPNYNVDRYNAAVIAFTKLNNAQQAHVRVQQDAERQKQAELQANRQVELKKLVEAIPELGNPQTGPALEAKLRAFAQSKGIAPDRIANWGATEVVLLHDAMKAAAVPEALAVAQKKAAKAPPVQQPGTTRETNKNDKVQEDFSRLQKTGRLDDAASVMRNFL